MPDDCTTWSLVEASMRLILEHFESWPLAACEMEFEDNVIHSVQELLEVQLAPTGVLEDMEEGELDDVVSGAFDLCVCTTGPPRHTASRVASPLTRTDVSRLQATIGALRSIPQPDQRTDEWYRFRKTYITASSAWKAFGTQSTLNQLIYDKCQPPAAAPGGGGVSIDSPLHWGQKYEPLSVMWYEGNYRTTVGEFGCIPHPSISCIAASPDGINVDPSNPRFGRMLEIKNVVSRQITGIPKKEYWIQMQLQMAVCGLKDCDFLEMKFEEYEDETAFLADGTYTHSADGKLKGRIMHFQVSGAPSYEYQPLGITAQEAAEWSTRVLKKRDKDTWVQDIHWRLDVVSCVLVEYNERWMAAAGTRLEQVWKTIQREKAAGCEHRAPKRRRTPSAPVVPIREPQCLLEMNPDGGECNPIHLEQLPPWMDQPEPPTSKRKLIHVATAPLNYPPPVCRHDS
tara:strand:- start:2917 stop:4284 length:1368 start_codon:yes stop_codon:yes gene_type:complete